jgi:hypothetical protein
LSLINILKKIAQVDGLLPFFFQHLSFMCPMPKQKKHLRPQLYVLCSPPHLAHLGLKSMSLRHANVICSSDLQHWHWMMPVIPGLDLLSPSIPHPK